MVDGSSLRGVNLGGWLVAERLTTPSLFTGVLGRDEMCILKELGEDGRERLREHHRTYITEADFKWLAEQGINAVRLPVPHWVFGDIEPYVGSIKLVDQAMDLAQKYKLQVLLDLHTAAGSQNGEDHSGRAGKIEWHAGPGNITRTVEIIEKLALRYGKYSCLWGIELLNEPSSQIPRGILEEYYRLAYEKVRAVCNPSVRVVMHDAFDPLSWRKFFEEYPFNNAILDLHLYQVFGRDDKKMGIHRHLKKALLSREMLATVQEFVPVIIGEWSLGLPARAFRGLDTWEADKARQAYGRIQINAYQQTAGWFFWTYKTEDPGGWNFRYSVEHGWLPPDFHGALSIEVPA